MRWSPRSKSSNEWRSSRGVRAWLAAVALSLAGVPLTLGAVTKRTTYPVAAALQPGLRYESYDGVRFTPMTDAGVQTHQNGSSVDTGQTYEAPGGYPNIMADERRDLFLLHPGTFTSAGVMASVGYPITTTGRFDVAGTFARANDSFGAGDGVRVLVLRNSTQLFASDISSQVVVQASDPFSGTGPVAFALTVDAAAGDVVRFVVSSGAQRVDGTFDATALRMSVRAAPTAGVGVIGPGGGTVSGSSGEQIRIPPGTFAADTMVAVASVSASDVERAQSFRFVDHGLIFLGAFAIQAGGATFHKRATLAVPQSPDEASTSSSLILVFHCHSDIDGDGVADLVLKDVATMVDGHLETSSDASLPGIDTDGTFVFVRTAFPVALLSGRVLDKNAASVSGSPITTFELPFLFALTDAMGAYTLPVPAFPTQRRRAVPHGGAGIPVSDLVPGGLGTIVSGNPNGGPFAIGNYALGSIPKQRVPDQWQVRSEADLLQAECENSGVLKRALVDLIDDIKDAISSLNFDEITFDPPSLRVLSCSEPTVPLKADLKPYFSPDRFVSAFPAKGTEYHQVKLLFGTYDVTLLTFHIGPIGYVAVDEEIPTGVVSHGGSSISGAQQLTTTINAVADGPGVSIWTDIVLLSLQYSLSLEIENLVGSCPIEEYPTWEVGLDPNVVLRVGPATVAVQGRDHCAPVIISFSASPSAIAQGEFSTLSWSTTDTTSVEISDGVGLQAPIGFALVSPTATTRYTLTATGPGGTASGTVTVIVDTPPIHPTIVFVATPPAIARGGLSTLSWTTTNATSVSIDGVEGPLNGTLAVSPAATTTYTLTARGPGGTVTATATVTVGTVAADLTGTYKGTFTESAHFPNARYCAGVPYTYSGSVDLSLIQSGSHLSGSITFTGVKYPGSVPISSCTLVDQPPITADNITGEVSGATLTLSFGAVFAGTVSGYTITMAMQGLPPSDSLTFTVTRVSPPP